eukprot:gene37959-51261_t
MLAGRTLQRRFISGYQDGGMRLSRATARGKAMRRLFHAGLTRAIFAKEWRLLARDPALAFQLVLRLIYMAPIVLVAFGRGHSIPLPPALAFASVLVATQLVGSLTWLTVSAEDAPELIMVAPVEKDDIDSAKLLAAFAMASPFGIILPIAIAFQTIPGAIATLVLTAIGGGLSGVVELQFGKPGSRSTFQRRQRSGSFIAGILNLIIAVAFGCAAGVVRWCTRSPRAHMPVNLAIRATPLSGSSKPTLQSRSRVALFWHNLCLQLCSSVHSDGTIRRLRRWAEGLNIQVFQLNEEGIHMPAFTFEKISPPVRRGPIAPVVQKQRGVIVQVLGRFVEARVQRAERSHTGPPARPNKPSPE